MKQTMRRNAEKIIIHLSNYFPSDKMIKLGQLLINHNQKDENSYIRGAQLLFQNAINLKMKRFYEKDIDLAFDKAQKRFKNADFYYISDSFKFNRKSVTTIDSIKEGSKR